MFKSHIQQYRSKLCISREKTTFKCKLNANLTSAMSENFKTLQII